MAKGCVGMALRVDPDQPLFMPGDENPLIQDEPIGPIGVGGGVGGAFQSLPANILTLQVDQLFALSRKNSLWPMTFGIACCAIEMIGTYMANYDLDRMGILPWPSPRQADVMLVAGTVNRKMARVVKRLWEQMPMPKWAIAMGSCADCGGPFYSYKNVIEGVDKVIPVDIYVPGCPPRPEALIDGFVRLQEKIMADAKAGVWRKK